MPGRDWLCVTGGALLAIVSFAAIVYSAYHGWYVQDLALDWAYGGIGFGFMFYALGVFVFAYGWTGGEMEPAVRLTFFICALTLATVVAIVLLLKSKGAGAKGAATAGQAAASAAGSDFNSVPVLHAVGSMLIPEEADDVVETRPGALDAPFSVTCGGCGARFAPVPPKALCPFCNQPALAV